MTNFHKWVVAGTLFIVIDINIGTIDMVPDVFGFILIAFAFKNVKWSYAQMGFYTALFLTVMSIVAMIYPSTINSSVPTLFSWEMAWVELISGTLFVLLFGCIFAVSKQIIPNDTSKFPKVFIAIQLMLLLWPIIFLHNTGSGIEMRNVLIFIPSIVMMIGIIVFLWRRKNMEQKLIEESRGPLVISPQ